MFCANRSCDLLKLHCCCLCWFPVIFISACGFKCAPFKVLQDPEEGLTKGLLQKTGAGFGELATFSAIAGITGISTILERQGKEQCPQSPEASLWCKRAAGRKKFSTHMPWQDRKYTPASLLLPRFSFYLWPYLSLVGLIPQKPGRDWVRWRSPHKEQSRVQAGGGLQGQTKEFLRRSISKTLLRLSWQWLSKWSVLKTRSWDFSFTLGILSISGKACHSLPRVLFSKPQDSRKPRENASA